MEKFKKYWYSGKTIKKKDKTVKEKRYYISSLEPEINLLQI